MPTASRSGMTIIELAVAGAIFALIMLGFTRVISTSGSTTRSIASVDALEDRARRALERVVAELRPASMSQLDPQIAANATSPELGYQSATGNAGTAIVWGPPSRIAFDDATGRVTLTRNEGLANQVAIVLASGVPALLQGELMNNADDNGNGLVDETGLSFAFEGGLVRVLLSLQATGPEGNLLTATVETRIRCWN